MVMHDGHEFYSPGSSKGVHLAFALMGMLFSVAYDRDAQVATSARLNCTVVCSHCSALSWSIAVVIALLPLLCTVLCIKYHAQGMPHAMHDAAQRGSLRCDDTSRLSRLMVLQ
jgi:hypothetical protein